MIVTELYNGQGLGNQLWCYVTTRVIALDKGYDFGIQSPEKFKGYRFMNLDFGKQVSGGNGPEGGPPFSLPNGIHHYYTERSIKHPDGSDIRVLDEKLINVPDNTKIDGYMQDSDYITHRKNEIKEWLTIRKECEFYDFSKENICIINFRGGTYTADKNFFLPKSYWENAISHMRKKNPLFRFIVITDDVTTARKFFPDFDTFHFSLEKDYVIIKNAQYLILSNSSFAWFPAWLNENLKFCIAPKYWGRHNTSDGYWSLGYNLTQGWFYQDRNGNLSDYESCLKELRQYNEKNKHSFITELSIDPFKRYSNILPQVVPSSIITKFSEKIKKVRVVFGTTRRKSSNLRGVIDAITFLKKELTLNLWKKVKKYLRPDDAKRIKRLGNNLSWSIKKLVSLTYIPKLLDNVYERRHKKNWLKSEAIREYRKKIRIYDIFTFFNELDLLEIRLQILDPYVDHFVIVEATKTFSGNPKPLYFKENKDKFRKWEHKIIHYVVENVPEDEDDLRSRLYANKHLNMTDREIIVKSLTSELVTKNDHEWFHWAREFYIKESVIKALTQLRDYDICYISDLDEIWNPELEIDYSKDELFRPMQVGYQYYLNNRSDENPWYGWTGTVVTKFKNIKTMGINQIRAHSSIKQSYTFLRNGGWHFGFMGGYEGAQRKITESNHFYYNAEETLPELKNMISKNKDHRERGIKLWKDERGLPRYILNNREKYKKLFL